MEGAKSKSEALLIKAAQERAAMELELLKRARKSVEVGGGILMAAAQRLDETQNAESPTILDDSDVAALIAASTNCGAAASNILRVLSMRRPQIQIVGAGDAEAAVGGSLIAEA